jgi:hypothetical protein
LTRPSDAILAADRERAARLQVTEAPTFLIGETRVGGARTLTEIEALLATRWRPRTSRREIGRPAAVPSAAANALHVRVREAAPGDPERDNRPRGGRERDERKRAARAVRESQERQ